eukprot:13456984-Ditylum_brightwellii.AAC.1
MPLYLEQKRKVIMKIRGVLVDSLIDLCPRVYEDHVVTEREKKVLYAKILKALHGMIVSSLLWYKKFHKDLESIGFIVNLYDVCVANQVVNNAQHTVTWHVDDIKSSHVDSTVNNDIYHWSKAQYCSDLNGHVKVTRGKQHDYLGMILDYSGEEKLLVNKKYYIKCMLDEFPHKVKTTTKAPWNE